MSIILHTILNCIVHLCQMATLDLENDCRSSQFRYRELSFDGKRPAPPDVIMVPITLADESTETHFAEVVQDAESAISAGVLPELIVAGSSGSYFVKDQSGVSSEYGFVCRWMDVNHKRREEITRGGGFDHQNQ